MSISWYDSSPTEIILINGSPITLFQGIQTYTLNLIGVPEVDITGVPSGTGYWLLDNVHTSAGSAVPEPATVSLLGIGLVGLIGYGRRQTKR